jgi:hypothetical protein
VAGKDGIKRRYGRNSPPEWFEADIGQENNCRAAIVCDGRPFCGKGGFQNILSGYNINIFP